MCHKQYSSTLTWALSNMCQVSDHAKRAIFLVCEHECELRMRSNQGNFDEITITRLVSATKSTATKFGGYGLRRGVNPLNTVHGALLSEALVMTSREPEALSSMIAAHIRAGAHVDPSFGMFIDPDDMSRLVSLNPVRARPFATIRNVGLYVRKALLHLNAFMAEELMYSAVATLRRAGAIAGSSPTELFHALGKFALCTDISECVIDEGSALELLQVSRSSGLFDFIPLHLSSANIASSIARNLRLFDSIKVTTIYETLSVEDASLVMVWVRLQLRKQDLPSTSILSVMRDIDKIVLLEQGVWEVSTFADVLKLQFHDVFRILEASLSVDVPMAWMLENARYALNPPFHTARLPMLRWPLRSAWGVSGVPIKVMFQMFGSDTMRVICELPDAIDMTPTLLSTFRALSDGMRTLPEQDCHGAIKTAVSLFRHAKISGHRFGAGDVKDAIKRTKLGKLVSRKCRRLDIVSLIHANELEGGAVSLADVCDLHRLVYARHQAIAKLTSIGAKFDIVEAVRILGARVLPLASQGGCVATSAQDIVHACQAMAVRRGKQSRWILSLLRALCAGRGAFAGGMCVHECSAADCSTILEWVPAVHRDEVHKLLAM